MECANSYLVGLMVSHISHNVQLSLMKHMYIGLPLLIKGAHYYGMDTKVGKGQPSTVLSSFFLELMYIHHIHSRFSPENWSL